MTVRNESTHSCPLIAGELTSVVDFMSAQLDCSDSELKPFINYLRQRHGKMLRARMLLLCGKLFGETNSLHIKLSAVAEMIHAATLLHDDVIDDGSKRRFHDTANSLWGANFAVLLGDYLLSRAFSITAALDRSDISRIFSDMAATICRGEMLQNVYRGNFSLTTDQYLDIIGKKTAEFFGTCCKLGAIASGADDVSCGRMYDLGMNFGMAFQIADDISDIFSTESRAGKTLGRDFRSKTLTLPVIYALKELDPVTKEEFLATLDANEPDQSRRLAILTSVGSLEFAESTAKNYRQKALGILSDFSCQSAKELGNLIISATKAPI